MSIQDELNKINNAVYGSEVRTAIHDSIKKTYDDASANGNANMEVEIARGTHPNLRSRLDETTTQLAQTANHVDNVEGAVNSRVDNLVIPLSPENSNVQVTDALVSTVKNKTFTTVRNRFEDIEGDIKDTVILAKNEFPNGDFSLDTDGNGLADGLNIRNQITWSLSNGVQTFTGTRVAGAVEAGITVSNPGDRYYISALVKSDSNLVQLKGLESDSEIVRKYHTGDSNFQLLSVIAKLMNSSISVQIVDDRGNGWTPNEVKSLVVINLTKSFGVGKEPDVSTMDRLMNKFPNNFIQSKETVIFNSNDIPLLYAKKKSVENGQTTTQIDDTDPRIKYVGSWTPATELDEMKYHKGTRHLGRNLGDTYFTFTFTGTGITVYDVVSPNRAYIEVFIDNINHGIYNRAGSPENYKQVAFSIGNLAQGEHTLKIAIAKEQWITTSFFDLDFIEVTSENNASQKIIDANTGTGMGFWVGSQSEYDQLPIKDANTAYLVGE